MVVRAARAEVQSAKSWRRPAAGPGARSRSADPRIILDPITQNNTQAASPHALPGHQPPKPGSQEVLKRRASDVVREPPPHAPRRSGHRPASVGTRLTPEPTSCSIPCEAADIQPRAGRSLLRKRECSRSSSSPSPPAFAFGDLNVFESEDGIEPNCSEDGSQRGNDVASSEGNEEPLWDPVALARELSDLPELQAIDQAIAAKIAELEKIESNQATLSERIESSEQVTREAQKVAVHLEASLAQKEAELEAIAPHHAPRQGASGMPKAPPLESLRPTPLDSDDIFWSPARPVLDRVRPTQLESDDASWLQARSAMGLLDMNKIT